MGPGDKKLHESIIDGAKSHHSITSFSGEQRGKAREETREFYMRRMFGELYPVQVTNQQAGISFYSISKRNCRTT